MGLETGIWALGLDPWALGTAVSHKILDKNDITMQFFAFLHLGNEYTNQEPLCRKSLPSRFLKKIKNSRFFALFCRDNFSGLFDLFFHSTILILIKSSSFDWSHYMVFKRSNFHISSHHCNFIMVALKMKILSLLKIL